MNDANNLINVFKKIKERVVTGTDSYNTVYKMFQKRSDIEKKMCDLFKSVIPSSYDKQDGLIINFITDVTNEANTHLQFSQEIEKKVLNPMREHSRKMDLASKSLLNKCHRDKMAIRKAVADQEKTQKAILDAQSKLPQMQGSKKDAQNVKIQKFTLEYQRKDQATEQLCTRIKTSTIPQVHDEFGDYDKQRLVKMSAAFSEFAIIKETIQTAIMQSNRIMRSKVVTYDGKDRSQSYVNGVFDPGNKNKQTPRGGQQNKPGQPGQEEEEQIPVAVALADYISDEPADLSFIRGDQIHLLVQHSSGWWEGELNGKTGLFPATYTMLSNSPQAQTDDISAIFLITHNYAKDGDLTILYGDLILVDSIIGGRVNGKNLRTQQFGHFPVDLLPKP